MESARPHAAMVSAGIASLSAKPMTAATRIATCWLADWNDV
jgi:hypothetical protein